MQVVIHLGGGEGGEMRLYTCIYNRQVTAHLSKPMLFLF
jgi:hypothetical protein